VKIVGTHWVLGSESERFGQLLGEVKKAIKTTHLCINPTRKGNGVRPIKTGVVSKLVKLKWSSEHRMNLDGMKSKPLDGFKTLAGTRAGFEWETGNISSSFRALMKLTKGILENQLDLGIHVLPSRPFYNFLTDRVGNISELLPYLAVFGRIPIETNRALVILVVEHDKEDKKMKLIPKGLDGNSLKRRKKKMRT